MMSSDFDYSKLFIDKNTKIEKSISTNSYQVSDAIIIND